MLEVVLGIPIFLFLSQLFLVLLLDIILVAVGDLVHNDNLPFLLILCQNLEELMCLQGVRFRASVLVLLKGRLDDEGSVCNKFHKLFLIFLVELLSHKQTFAQILSEVILYFDGWLLLSPRG